MNQLAYSPHATCAIMDANGYTMAEIEAFLIANADKARANGGYFLGSTIPGPKK